MSVDIERVRRETPGCHGMFHFNNAGTSLAARPTMDAVSRHLADEASMGGYEAMEAAAERTERVWDSAARLLNCSREEIALQESATRAWNTAFYSVPLRPGDRILTGDTEYGSSYIALQHGAHRSGATVEVIPPDEHGQVSLAALEAMLDERVRLVAVTHVPTNSGLVNPVAEIGRLAKSAGALYLVDACQSAGQMPLDVGEIGCDMLALTGRKFLRGPRGTGLLYVRKEALDPLEPPFLEMRGAQWTGPTTYTMLPDARRFETWECSIACRLGFGAAIDYALETGLHNIEARIGELSSRIRDRLREVRGVRLYDRGVKQCGIITLSIQGMEAAEARRRLSAARINTWVSPRSSSPVDMGSAGIDSLLRVSPHYYNTEEECDVLCSAIEELGRG